MYKAAILLTACLSGTAGWVISPELTNLGTYAEQSSSEPPTTVEPRQVVQGTGYVEPASELRRLVFKTDGVIGTCSVKVGQALHQGDLIMSLDNSDQLAAVAVAEEEMHVAAAESDKLLSGAHEFQILAAQRKVDLLREQVRHGKRQFERIAALAKSKASTQSEFDRAETDWRQSEHSFRQAEAEFMQLKKLVRPEDRMLVQANVKLARSKWESEKEHLAKTTLVAPFDGVVLEILKREGEGASHLEPVVVFGDESQLRVRAEIDERYVHQLKVGQTATIHGAGLGQRHFTGTVVIVKRLMGKKTVFTHEATERKDLDVLQVLIDMPADFRPPLGLQVDVDIEVQAEDHGTI